MDRSTKLRLAVILLIILGSVWYLVPSIRYYSMSESERDALQVNEPLDYAHLEDNALKLGLTGLAAAAFVVFAALVGTRVIQQYSIHLEKLRVGNAPFLVSIIVMLGLSALAGIIGLAAIIGPCLAGMILAEAKEGFNL